MARVKYKDALAALQLIDNIPTPTTYDLKKVKVAALTCRSDQEFADFLEIDILVFKHWCNTHPGYRKEVAAWRSHTTSEIERSLAKRAIGFKKITRKDVMTKTGQVVTLETETYYPPDTAAAQFWLKNRAPEEWKDSTQVDVNVQADIRAWLIAAGEPVDQPKAIEGSFEIIEQPQSVGTINSEPSLIAEFEDQNEALVDEPLNVNEDVIEQPIQPPLGLEALNKKWGS